MKITFFSNFLNHHQLPLCLELLKIEYIDFHFIAMQPMNKERKILGYKDMNVSYKFCILAYENENNYQIAERLAIDSDVVIWGDAPYNIIEKRLLNNKLTFRFTERLFKKWYFRFSPEINEIYKRANYKNLYILCAGAYVSQDFNEICLFQNKMFKWGYFPETKHYDLNSLFQKKNNSVFKLLWCGRFLNWKHPELAIEAAKYLKINKINFHLTMIGEGKEKEKIKQKIFKANLFNEVSCLDSKSPEVVRSYMEESDVFLMTSDAYEGWGAVVNEAMNSGCVVLGDIRIGSIPFLITDSINGLTYATKEEYFEKLLYLTKHKSICKQMGINAYNTIVANWNSKIAANNFVDLSYSLLFKENISIKCGPCSFAG